MMHKTGGKGRKESGVAVFISDRADLRPKPRERQPCSLTKRTIHLKGVTIVSRFATSVYVGS